MSSHLEIIAASPRPVGSEANRVARRYCADHLRSVGFDVDERPFEFSALPGRYAAQVIGITATVGYGLSLLLSGARVAMVTSIGIAVLVAWLGDRRATLGPWLRESGVNLEAKRGGSPRVWLVAHIDSKSQPISSALRTIGAIALGVGVFGAFLGPLRAGAITLGLAGGIILAFAAVGSHSPGAADDASGVAAVLEAAAMVPADRSLGVLITDAEELALAGATAWVQGREPGIALNCDTVDDDGRLTVFRYGQASREVDARAGPVARELDPEARVMRPPPGVLTDSNAFRKAGWQTVTLARGTIRTLNRIHTNRDSLAHLRGTGIPDAARVLARLAEELA